MGNNGSSRSAGVSGAGAPLEHSLAPLVSLDLLERHVLDQLIASAGLWGDWASNFRLTCIDWNQIRIPDFAFEKAFKTRFPFSFIDTLQSEQAATWRMSYCRSTFEEDAQQGPSTTILAPLVSRWRHKLDNMVKEAQDIPGGHAAGRDAAIERHTAERSFVDRLYPRQREMRGLVIGLDGAGKTTLLHNCEKHVGPVGIGGWGSGVETKYWGNLHITSWDLGGQDKVKPLWRHYYGMTEAVIFVVDSSDLSSIPKAASELHSILNEAALLCARPSLPVLVFATKQDLAVQTASPGLAPEGEDPAGSPPRVLSASELWDALHLSAFDRGLVPPELGQYNIHVQPCAFMCGTERATPYQKEMNGLKQGMAWLQEQLPEWQPEWN